MCKIIQFAHMIFLPLIYSLEANVKNPQKKCAGAHFSNRIVFHNIEIVHFIFIQEYL